jgi:hypothetical protein
VPVLSRHPGGGGDSVHQFPGDVTTGAGLAAAMDGAGAVVDVPNVVTLDEDVATRFFV